ncbi:kinase-like protein [Thelephora ganbajun]|uniref:Kinase-like protein n=1 Tax=Thelephora ganbajun TaxID=370292 RepID=A0ACB6Z4M4_THEGA|nr:kinase-like protein [Thelephora ganbajun]
MFSSHNQVEMTGHLSADDAQILIDVIDEGLDGLAPLTRSRCLHYSYKICGHQAVVPRSLEIPLCYDPTADPLYRGAFADIRKGRHNGREVVAKALRLSLKDDFEPIRKKFCREVVMWKALRHPNLLPLIGVSTTENRLMIVSEWMGNGNINEFLKANVDADRLGLLAGVTRGLIYMHDQEMIHGNLKGANVLIDENRCACLADFSLPAIFSDESIITSTAVVSSNVQWMSQELLFPEEFGLKESRPTKESDCYALGTVIYEVLSGQVPFAQLPDPVVPGKVQRGELPERPQGEGGKLFIDGMWGVSEHCWKRQPGERISAEAVLLGLEGNTALPMLSSNAGGDVEMDSASDFSAFSPFRPKIHR